MLPRKERRQILRDLEKAQKGFDETRPLILEGGWLHKCGSPAKSGGPFFFVCEQEGKAVPSSEVRRAG